MQKMQLSATYADRFFISTLPYSILGLVCIQFEKYNSIIYEIIMFLIITISIWLADGVTIYFKKIKPLLIDQGIYIDNKLIQPSSIIEISLTGGRYPTIIFEIQEVNSTYFATVLVKPMWFLGTLFGQKSKTLTKLLEFYPELEDRIVS